MDGKKTLVAFYSSSGHTRSVGQAIAARLSADVEEIVPVTSRPVDLHGKGLRNFSNMGRAVFPALSSRSVPIREPQHDPANYDLIVVGTPVYAASLSGPARAYLLQHQARFSQVAFFCTGEDPASSKVLQQMEEACSKSPRAVAAFRAEDIVAGKVQEQVEQFVSRLQEFL